MATISFPTSPADALKRSDQLLLLAPARLLKKEWLSRVLPAPLVRRALGIARDLRPGAMGQIAESLDDAAPRRLVVASLPDELSRHNSPTRQEAIAACTRRAALRGRPAVIAAVDDPAHAVAAAIGICRSFPLYDRRTGRDDGKARGVAVVLADGRGNAVPLDAEGTALVEGSRWAARLVDTPPAELNTADFVREARTWLRGVRGLRVQVLAGAALERAGLDGIASVGQAARVGPRLLILEWRPPRAKRTVALVGKGIVYDTGGLSLKPTASMSGMKGDMAGAAAVAGAMKAIAAGGSAVRVIALCALAENAIGPGSYRNDDILTLHSGHTVEINNTDAEGRLLLGDAVSFAARKYQPDAIFDIATLTGAQLVATGIRHAAVVSNRRGLEEMAVTVGQECGDLVFPLPFAPEFFQSEFKSAVADMKNSVGNRSNAQSSCAAQFVYSHIDDLDVPWMHFDIAGPAFRDERGTGFGVSLLAGCVRALNGAALAAR
jgi:probable aminopeptidase NPEPL1